MVSHQLRLKAILSNLVLWSHDPCIFDQHVNDRHVTPGVDLTCSLADILEGPKVQLEKNASLDSWLCSVNLVGCLMGFVLVAGSENQV